MAGQGHLFFRRVSKSIFTRANTFQTISDKSNWAERRRVDGSNNMASGGLRKDCGMGDGTPKVIKCCISERVGQALSNLFDF